MTENVLELSHEDLRSWAWEVGRCVLKDPGDILRMGYLLGTLERYRMALNTIAGGLSASGTVESLTAAKSIAKEAVK